MSAQIIDGKDLAAKMRKDIAATIRGRASHGLRKPGLAVILVGSDPASQIYVQNKRQACAEVDIESFYFHFPEETSEAELLAKIEALNTDNNIDGILVQLPLPQHIDCNRIIERILPTKDVDGFHPYNLGRLAQSRPALRPCTPFGIMTLLDSIHTIYPGRHAVIVGASNIVGRPMALELLMAGCTITICHSLTQDIKQHIEQGDIVVSAVGSPGLIKGAWIKPGATVIDVGITRLPDGRLVGDVEFDEAVKRAAWITPVPGGVGPMTVVSLLKNTVQAAMGV